MTTKAVRKDKRAPRKRPAYIVCKSCRKREYQVTEHNRACGRCWPCHRNDPCIVDNDAEEY